MASILHSVSTKVKVFIIDFDSSVMTTLEPDVVRVNAAWDTRRYYPRACHLLSLVLLGSLKER